MEWWLVLLIIFGGLLLLMSTGMPVAFAFLLMNIVGMFVFCRGELGLLQLIYSLKDSITTFAFVPIPLFILMGEVMFLSGVAPRLIDNLDKWLGQLPGRLGLLAVTGGTLLSTLTGSSIGSTVLLGSVLTPDMEARGYKKAMSLGPILGSGGLAMMIPPSALAVLVATLAEVSIAGVLVGGIFPGLLMAILYGSYITVRCWLQPSIAPPYKVMPTPLSEKLLATVKYVLPMGFIIFMVIGLIILGVATPSESAAMGCLGSVILAALYGRLSWEVVKKSAFNTILINVMLLMIVAGSKAFSQILALSGGAAGLTEFMIGLPLTPIALVIVMQVLMLLMGMFMSSVAVLMITIPIFMPIIHALGFSPLWFGLLMLLDTEMAVTSPPYGVSLFAMKGVAPPDTTMGDIYRAALPFLGCDLIVLALMIAFPTMVLWLPGIIR